MTEPAPAPVGPYVLPPLRFAIESFEPVLDAETMRIHHDRHHQGYVDTLNAALSRYPEWLGHTIEDVLRRLHDLPNEIRRPFGTTAADTPTISSSGRSLHHRHPRALPASSRPPSKRNGVA